MKLAAQLSSISAYKRCESHLVTKTSHGAIGGWFGAGSVASSHSQPAAGPCCTFQLTLTLAALLCAVPACILAVTLLGVLLGVTLTLHEVSWFLSGGGVAKVGVAARAAVLGCSTASGVAAAQGTCCCV